MIVKEKNKDKEEYTIDFKKLKEQNNETVAWIKVKNTNILLNTEDEECKYEVFSVYKIESEDYYIKTELKNDNEFETFINTIKGRSIKKIQFRSIQK